MMCLGGMVVLPERAPTQGIVWSDNDEFSIDMSRPFTECVKFALGQWCVDRCVAKKGTAEVKRDVRHDSGEVCSWESSSDELQTEKSQRWDWARSG